MRLSVSAVAGGAPVGLPGQTSPAMSPSPRQPCQLRGDPSPPEPGPGSLTLRHSCPLCPSAARHAQGPDSCWPRRCARRASRHPGVHTAGATRPLAARLLGCGAPYTLSSRWLRPLPPAALEPVTCLLTDAWPAAPAPAPSPKASETRAPAWGEKKQFTRLNY